MRILPGRYLLGFALATNLTAADAQRGEGMVSDQGCLECHSVQARGSGHEASGIARDLGAELASHYTAPALASALWNHTPAMWDQLSARVLAKPQLADTDWTDVFAYLYSLQFFELPGQARQGKATFEDKGCSGCHALREKGASTGPPVVAWARRDDPIALVYDMWTHAAQMERAFLGQETAWKKLSGQDFVDLTVYAHAIQGRSWDVSFSLPEPDKGSGLFSDHCAGCHMGPLSLTTLVQNQTWLSLGAALWNHGPLAVKPHAVSEPEMRSILAYVWQLQYMGQNGDAGRGQTAFRDKGCISCHRTPGLQEPLRPRAGKVFTPFSMVALGWGNGRQMHRQMIEKGVPWPKLSAADVSNLVAYMNTLQR